MFFSKADQRALNEAIGDPIVWTPATGRAKLIKGTIEHKDVMHESADGSVQMPGQETILHVPASLLPGFKNGDKFRAKAGGITYQATKLPEDGSGFLELSLLKVN